MDWNENMIQATRATSAQCWAEEAYVGAKLVKHGVVTQVMHVMWGTIRRLGLLELVSHFPY